MAKLNLFEQVQARTGTAAVSLNVKDIPIGEIITRQNVRTDDTTDITDLKASIKAAGLLQPITVYKDADNYVVVIGHRRLRAFRELYTDEPDRFHSIRCIVTDNQNITVRQLIENVQRTDLKPIELYHALKELKGQGLTIKQIADVIGKAEGYVKNLFSGIKEADADPQNLEILQKSHHVTLSVLQATRAVKNKAERKKLLLKAAEKKITQRELQHKVRAVKNKGKPPRIAALDLNVDRFLIKIKFNERYTFYKIAAEVKKTLKRHNIKIKGV